MMTVWRRAKRPFQDLLRATRGSASIHNDFASRRCYSGLGCPTNPDAGMGGTVLPLVPWKANKSSHYRFLFNRSEYLQRIHNTKVSMSAAGMDTLIVSDPANMCYLSGYDAWSFYVHQCLVVSMEEEEPYWIGRKMDAAGAKLTSFLDDDNILYYTDEYVQSTTLHPMEAVADFLKEKGWDRSHIGVEMDAYYYNAACHHNLVKSLPQAVFKDATSLVNWVRVVKSPREIMYMTQAARISERVMQTGIDAVSIGVRQCDAVAQIYEAAVKGTPEYGGDYPSIVPMLPTGVDSAAPHLTWTSTPFIEGQGTVLELCGCRHRYHVPMARTVFLGSPPEKLMKVEQVVLEGMEAALAAAKPGNTAEDVQQAWNEVLMRNGVEKDSRLGYSVGLNYPPDWGEHTISLRAGDKTPLEKNMTLHMIAGMWMDDWGMELSEVLCITDDGCKTLCNFPRQVFVKEDGKGTVDYDDDLLFSTDPYTPEDYEFHVDKQEDFDTLLQEQDLAEARGEEGPLSR